MHTTHNMYTIHIAHTYNALLYSNFRFTISLCRNSCAMMLRLHYYHWYNIESNGAICVWMCVCVRIFCKLLHEENGLHECKRTHIFHLRFAIIELLVDFARQFSSYFITMTAFIFLTIIPDYVLLLSHSI